MSLALTARAYAEEATPSEPIGEAAIEEVLSEGPADEALIAQEAQPDPSQGDFPNSFLPGKNLPLGPNVTLKESTEVDGKSAKQLQRQMKAWEQQQRQLLEQQKKFENEYRRALAEFEQAQQTMPNQMRGERDALEQQVQMLRAQLAQMAAQQQQAKSAPLPENAVLRVFKLKYVKAEDVASALRKILGDMGPRIAIDERTNMLLIAGDDRQNSVVEHVIQSLDEPGADGNERQSAETLQLRIVWLLDGVDGKDPNSGLVSPQVLDALRQLGFDGPSVVCQQVTTMTLGQGNNLGQGQFQFFVPVLINGQAWQLAGNGMVAPVGGERFSLQFELEVEQQGSPQKSRLGGSIYSPLGHYTVMGTTTFVETIYTPVEGGVTSKQDQHLSAFVVYLDRAPEFPASTPAAADRKRN